MNFLNFLTSAGQLFNFNLQSTDNKSLKENNSLTSFTQPSQKNSTSSFSKVQRNDHKITSNEQSSSIPDDQVKKILLGQQQMLINQYLELNIKYLSQQLQNKPNQVDDQQLPGGTKTEENKNQKIAYKKKIKKVNSCGHEDKLHYAKGMCNNCYHKFGRIKKPWNCSHSKLYAAGMCQNCYINNYNRKRREGKESKVEQQDYSSRIIEEPQPEK